MTDQLSFGQALADDAIAAAEEHADKIWLAQAALAIRVCTGIHREGFTTDQVWVQLADLNADTPHEPRAMGAAVRAAIKSGLIRATGEWRPSSRPESHGRPVRVWSGVPLSEKSNVRSNT